MLFRKRKLDVSIKLRSDKATLPIKGTKNSAGYDIFSSENVCILPEQSMNVFTDISLEIPNGYFGLISIRNSLSTNYNLTLSNGVGIIDSDYRGEIVLRITNNGYETYNIKQGERIAQLMLLPMFGINFKLTNSLSKTERKEYGFCCGGETGE